MTFLPSDRALGCLLGGIFGMLATCCLAIGVLMLPEDAASIPDSVPPSMYDIEAIVEEDYVNRTFLDSAAGLPQPVPLVAGHLDLHTGGWAEFAVQAEMGPLQPVFHGTIALRATETGELDISLARVRVGSISVTRFVPADMLAAINRDVNRQLAERTGDSKVRLIGVSSDETTLRFYLVPAP
jgi:hypothetical protein